jgi:hypothetical protein
MEHRRQTDSIKTSAGHVRLAVFAYGTLASAFALLALLLFWRFYPYVVVTYRQDTFRIVEASKSAPQGGALSYEYDYVKYMAAPVTVSKQFVDGLIFQSDSPVTVRPVGSGHVHCQIPIPQTLPPGTYKLRITAVYQVNPIRTITITHDTEFFTVTAHAK